MLATPYSLDYDLMLLAPAIAFLAADGLARGFAPWEKTALALAVDRAADRALGARKPTLIPLAVPLMLRRLSRFCCIAPCAETGGAPRLAGVLPARSALK